MRPFALAPITMLATLLACGCAPHRPPAVAPPLMNDDALVRTTAERLANLKTVTGEASLVLTRPNGESVRLDSALVLSLPDRRVRLRAWKFNQAVFDLTLTPAGLWVEAGGDADRRRQALPAGLSAARLARALPVLSGELLVSKKLRHVDSRADSLTVAEPNAGGGELLATIDRATAAVSRYELRDDGGARGDGSNGGFVLSLSDYRTIDKVPFPQHWVAKSEFGTIDVRLRDVELNGEIPASAFVPPAGAEMRR